MAKKPKDTKTNEAPAAATAADGAVPAKGIKALLANRKLVMMGGAGLVVLLVAGGAGAWAFGLLGGARPAPTQADAAAQPGAPGAAAAARRVPHFMDLPEMTVNLSANAQRPQYLRVRISLELAEAALASQIQPMMPRVIDTFQVYLREMRAGDLEGAAGMQRLREELVRRVNLSVAPARVDAVLFREILVQ